ncbi:MAG: hypothetical protein HQ492_00625 [Woeseiaceae bacterium]|nr:hypothetical protein [Woeseiaceae bacterium]
MWLPTPIYERIPQFWFFIGLLFIAGGLYVGVDIPMWIIYIVLGFLCCAFGLAIAVLRMKHRRDDSVAADSQAAPQ